MNDGGRITAPWWPVAATSMSALASISGALVGSGLWGQVSVVTLIAGYLLGAIASVVFQVLYKTRRNGLRPRPTFRPQPGLDRFVNIAMLGGIVAGLANAFFLATELAK